MSPKSLTDLPSDVLVEILARLPLRTLIVSKSVCKTFLSLSTHNPHFIDLHSSNAGQIPVFQFGGYGNPSFLLRMADPEADYAATENSDLKPLFHLPKTGVNVGFRHPYSLRENNMFSLINSCNGLVYFCNGLDQEDGISMVCNPVTNEYIVIPGIPNIRSEPLSIRMWLGFSPGTNQYKVLRISSSISSDKLATQVFVIGSDSWRDIDATRLWKDLFLCNSCPTLANGLMYWHYETWTHLASFDFEREKFGVVALPPEFKKYQVREKKFGGLPNFTSIGVLGDCLCVSCNVCYDHRVYLWVMRKQNSWTKEFVFDTVRPSCGRLNCLFKPLQLLRNGQVLMLVKSFEQDLVCYDPKTETLRYFGLHEQLMRSNAGIRFVVPLTPSFVPLKETLKVEKVMKGYVRPRCDKKVLSKEEGDFGTTNLLSRNCPKNLKEIQNMIRGVLDSLCWGNQKQLVRQCA